MTNLPSRQGRDGKEVNPMLKQRLLALGLAALPVAVVLVEAAGGRIP